MKTLDDNKYLSPPWSTAFPWLAGWCTNKTAGPRAAPCAPPGAPAAYECAALPTGNRVRNFAGVAMRRNGTFDIPTAPGFPFLNPNSPCPAFVVDDEFNDVDFAAQHFYRDTGVFVDAEGGDFTLRPDSAVLADMPDFVRVNFREIGIGGRARL